jgi:hypothetical protein
MLPCFSPRPPASGRPSENTVGTVLGSISSGHRDAASPRARKTVGQMMAFARFGSRRAAACIF